MNTWALVWHTSPELAIQWPDLRLREKRIGCTYKCLCCVLISVKVLLISLMKQCTVTPYFRTVNIVSWQLKCFINCLSSTQVNVALSDCMSNNKTVNHSFTTFDVLFHNVYKTHDPNINILCHTWTTWTAKFHHQLSITVFYFTPRGQRLSQWKTLQKISLTYIPAHSHLQMIKIQLLN